MSNKLKVAFLVVATDSNKDVDKTFIESAVVDLLTVIVKNYKEAAEVAVQLVNEGYNAIELCAGFGNKGVGIVSEAISYKIPVGVVRFDNHPGLNNMSGDELFQK